MRTIINKIKQFIESILHRHCGTPKCCKQCGSKSDKDNTYETLYGGNDE